jgi:hypothetical protein
LGCFDVLYVVNCVDARPHLSRVSNSEV